MSDQVAPESMIRLESVSKTFPGASRPAVADLSLEVGRGEFVTLVGPSGCGKTTTLRMINRLVEPTSGRILIDGKDALATPAHELRRSIGYVIQQIGLFPHRTIGQNIATVPGLLGWEPGRVAERVRELVDVVGLDPEMLERYPAELSGGQQQRVGVARALAADPPVLLMDEPFGAVDPIVRKHLQHEFHALQEKLAKTVVFVTHDVDEAVLLGDRMAILNVGGVLEQYDEPAAILAAPANGFVEDFLGGERGLKRLGLLPVGEAGLRPGPVIDITASREEARRVVQEEGTDWLGLVDDGRLLGWVWASEIGETPLGDVQARPFLVTLSSDATLRSALDAVVTGHARVAMVVDDGVYKGMLDLEDIAGEVTE
jgi:osmoprotectant transport system ATP-binding protein